MQVVIDLNDISVFVDAEAQKVRSPGFALLQSGQDPILGDIALHQSRLSPASVANRFWRDLSLNPVGIRHPQVRHQADLVWHHIKQINTEASLDQALFLCPSHYSEEQLSLLSGILKAQGITPAALIKRALALGAIEANSSHSLELQLHQILLTPLEYKKGELITASARALAVDGYLGALDLVLKTIQKRFIRETRFDPLHHANTEQQLVDALPTILTQLGKTDSAFASVQVKDDEYRAEVRREELVQALEPLWNDLRSALPLGSKVLVDEIISQFPGFETLELETRQVAAEDITRAAPQIPLPESSDADSPIFLTRGEVGLAPFSKQPSEVPQSLDSATEVSVAPVRTASSIHISTSTPTHLLHQGVARRSSLMWIGVSNQGRLEIVEKEPSDILARCAVVPDGLEIEAVGEVQINGEKLVGKRLLQIADHLSASDIAGGVTAIQVAGDVS